MSSPWPRHLTMIAALVASVLLPIEAGHAGFLSDLFKGSSKQAKSPPKTAEPPKHAIVPKPAEPAHEHLTGKPRPAAPTAQKCEPSKFRLVVDVGHTAASDGAMSARNVPEFSFNLHLAQRLVEKLKSEGFGQTKLLVTEGKARPSLAKRVAAANNLKADLFLSIHHDSVPDKMMENWEYEGKKSHFNDRFSGYGVFVAKTNPDFESSFRFARLIGQQMRAQGFKFADQYTLPIMGKNRHILLDKEAGVYRYNRLIVLKNTDMPAALLEAGSISNRDEELQVASPERQDKTVAAVTAALREYCGLPPVPPQAPPDAQAKADH